MNKLLLLIFITIIFSNCKKNNDSIVSPVKPQSLPNSVTDADGNIYPIVTIGQQVWMSENLKVTKYNDGTPIPLIEDNSAWGKLTTPGMCWYNNDQATYFANKYGALYNWYAVNSGKLCPKGWHVPTDAEWTILSEYLGGSGIAGGKMKEAGTAHWSSPNTGANNHSGFNGLPAGTRYNDGAFENISFGGNWWTSTNNNTYNIGISRALIYNVESFNPLVITGYTNKYGFSVRCIKD